jgi:hypothetical protein
VARLGLNETAPSAQARDITAGHLQLAKAPTITNVIVEVSFGNGIHNGCRVASQAAS